MKRSPPAARVSTDGRPGRAGRVIDVVRPFCVGRSEAACLRTKQIGVRLVAFFALAAAAVGAQTVVRPDDALLNVLVFGTHVEFDTMAFSGALKSEIEGYLRRAASYRSTRPVPPSGGVREMVYAAQVSYERRLAAVSGDPDAPRLAAGYVESLRPCYEWEGLHECPEREALFADEYQAAHPDGPFGEYLPLLSAHRWLCAAEAFAYEQRPGDVSRSRRLYQERVAVARRSRVLLIRTAAERLSVRGRCL